MIGEGQSLLQLAIELAIFQSSSFISSCIGIPGSLDSDA